MTANSKTLLDHAYVSNPDNIIHISVPTYAISDHHPICITRKCSQSFGNSTHKFISYRDIKHLNITDFMGDMYNAPWSSINALSSPEEALGLWLDMFNTILNNHMPLIHKRVQKYHQPKWISPEIINAMKTRDQLKKSGDHINYKLWRNKDTNSSF